MLCYTDPPKNKLVPVVTRSLTSLPVISPLKLIRQKCASFHVRGTARSKLICHEELKLQLYLLRNADTGDSFYPCYKNVKFIYLLVFYGMAILPSL